VSAYGTGCPNHGPPGQRFWPGRVTGQCVRSMFEQVLSFNMRVYRGVVSTEYNTISAKSYLHNLMLSTYRF